MVACFILKTADHHICQFSITGIGLLQPHLDSLQGFDDIPLSTYLDFTEIHERIIELRSLGASVGLNRTVGGKSPRVAGQMLQPGRIELGL